MTAEDSLKHDSQLPTRKYPVHLPNLERHNQPVIIFVTVCTHKKQPVLANDTMHHLLLQAWNEAKSHRVGSYVVMPDHVHLFCSPTKLNPENVKKWVGYWKRLVSIELKQPEPLWQRDCWDTQLRNVSHYTDKWQYVFQNPVRSGLIMRPDDWPFKGVLNELRW